jgi:plasmid stabilization system protein ParE
MPRVDFDPDALADLDAIYDYIGRASRSLERADQVVDRIHEACELYPMFGVGHRKSLRRKGRIFRYYPGKEDPQSLE